MKMLRILIGIASISILYPAFAQPSTIQAVYNSGDQELQVVDLYAIAFGQELAKIEDVSSGQITGTIQSPISGITVTLGIAPSNSTSVAEALKTIDVALEPNKNYLAIGTGILENNKSNYFPNPDGRDIGLDAYIIDNARVSSSESGKVEFVVFHGVTDAPTVDVRVQDGATLVDNLGYGEFSSYVAVDPGPYTLEVTDQSGSTVVARFEADLSAYPDSALVVFAGGFLTPSQNQNGPSFNMTAGTRGGRENVFTRTFLVGIESLPGSVATRYRLEQNYPNPFNPSTTIEFSLPQAETVTLAIYDISGRLVETVVEQPLGAGVHRVSWTAGNLPSGVYFYQLQTANFSQTRKLMLVK